MSFLEKAVQAVKQNLKEGHYNVEEKTKIKKTSLIKQLRKRFTLIAEIKPVSPTHGSLFSGSAAELAREYATGGAGALSVLCEKTFFSGSLESITEAKKTGLPVLAKDFVLSEAQLEAYAAKGADAVLLIHEIFAKHYAEKKLNEMIECARQLGLEVVLEVYDKKAFVGALETKVDVIGVNNRNLDSLELNVNHYSNVVDGIRFDKPVIAESGFETRQQIQEAKEKGLRGVLVGTALLKGGNPAEKLRELI